MPTEREAVRQRLQANVTTPSTSSVNDTIDWSRPQVTTSSKKRKAADDPTVGKTSSDSAAPSSGAAAQPSLVDWNLNKRISEANARYQRTRSDRDEQMERGEIEKTGLRKAFEELRQDLAASGPSPSGTSGGRKPPDGTHTPNLTLRNFLGVPQQ